MKRSVYAVMLAALLLFCALPVRAEENKEKAAKDLSVHMIFAFKDKNGALTDQSLKTVHVMEPNKSYKVSWDGHADPKSVLFEFRDIPGAYKVRFYNRKNKLLKEEEGKPYYAAVYALPEGTKYIKFVAGTQIRLSTWKIYSAGRVDSSGLFEWEPIPDKLDYMVVATHFDDDVLFLGAVVPIYGAGQGRPGTVVYTASSSHSRLMEAYAGAREMGLVYKLLTTGFRDVPLQTKGIDFNEANLNRYLVKAFRQYKPDVVVTQATNGEYGHWQHKMTSACVIKAVSLAADERYDPESAAAYGTWQVSKLYVHLYPKNKIRLNVNEPIEALGGRTALQAARDAFQCHASQVKIGRYSVTNRGLYDLTAFGLAFTAVGPDTPGVNDMFEHVPQSSAAQEAA